MLMRYIYNTAALGWYSAKLPWTAVILYIYRISMIYMMYFRIRFFATGHTQLSAILGDFAQFCAYAECHRTLWLVLAKARLWRELLCLSISIYGWKQASKCQQRKKEAPLSLRHRPKEGNEGNEGSRKRFLEARDDDLEKAKKKPTCKNMERSHLWATNVYSEWLKFHCSKEGNKEYFEADLYG